VIGAGCAGVVGEEDLGEPRLFDDSHDRRPMPLPPPTPHRRTQGKRGSDGSPSREPSKPGCLISLLDDRRKSRYSRRTRRQEPLLRYLSVSPIGSQPGAENGPAARHFGDDDARRPARCTGIHSFG
jgi:hypothetical protein